MGQPQVIYAKLGGSLITEKTREATARLDAIRQLADEIRTALDRSPGIRLALGHGSGSFGHFAAQRYGVHLGAQDKSGFLGMALTSAAAARLNRIVTDVCLDAGLPVISFQPSASARCDAGHLIEMAVLPIEEALSHGLIPLVYGDVAFDVVQGATIISTEDVFAFLASRIPPSRILMVGVVDGIYEKDPLREPQARRLDVVTPALLKEAHVSLGGSHAIDVTGGMLGKMRRLLPLLERNPRLTVHVFSGEIPGQLTRALLGDTQGLGTLVRSG